MGHRARLPPSKPIAAPRTPTAHTGRASASQRLTELSATSRFHSPASLLSLQRAAGNRAATHLLAQQSIQAKPADVQRTEIDAIKYININGLYQGPRGGNWLIKYLAKLCFDGYYGLYKTIYDILVENLPEQPLEARDAYDPPTRYEVNSALRDEIENLNNLAAAEFGNSLSSAFSINHVRDDEGAAIDRCRDRLSKTSTSDNTVLILTLNEKKAILRTLAQARQENWDYINVSCGKAVQAGGIGIYKIFGVSVRLSLNKEMEIHHLNGWSLEYQKKEAI